MGYTTEFTGKFKLNKKLDKETHEYLVKFNESRRMKRKFPNNEYGIDGEFFVEGLGFRGQEDDKTVFEHNTPPSTQPGLWCQWVPTKDGKYIVWDECEKFYDYIPWLEYILKNFLIPKGYTLTGVVHWVGEEEDDIGTIQAIGDKIIFEEGVHAKNLQPNSVDFIKKLNKKNAATKTIKKS